MLIFKDFSFDSAHQLPLAPTGHPCQELHGHSYHLRVYISGNPKTDTGWILDFGEMKIIVLEIIRPLDHHFLNEIPGLENPTCELLIKWIWDRLIQKLPGLARLELNETSTCGVIYEGY